MKNRLHSHDRSSRRRPPGLVAVPLVGLAGLLGLLWSVTPAGAQEHPRCVKAVQRKIAWNDKGDTRWNAANVRRLCAGAEDSVEPARCFREVLHGGVDRGGGTRWRWNDGVALCRGTRDAEATIACFERRVEALGRKKAIKACRWDASKQSKSILREAYRRGVDLPGLDLASNGLEFQGAGQGTGQNTGQDTGPDPFFASVPASRRLRRMLASGRQDDYRVFVLDGGGPIHRVTPRPWNGVILLRDPARVGTLVRWDADGSRWRTVADARQWPASMTWYRSPEGSVSKKLLADDGRFVGTVTLGPGSRFSVTLDGDRDRVVDLVYAEWRERSPRNDPRFRELFLANEHGPGLRMMEELWRGHNPLCNEGARKKGARGVGFGKARRRGRTTSLPGTVDACSRPGGSGGGGSGIDVGRNGGTEESGLSERCKSILAQGMPGAGVGLTSDPSDKGLTGQVVDWIMNGSDGERDSPGVNTIRTVGGGWILAGEAAIWDNAMQGPFGLLEAWGGADRRRMEDGKPPTLHYGDGSQHPAEPDEEPSRGGMSAGDDDSAYFDTDGDGEIDAKDSDGDGAPDTNVSPEDVPEPGGKAQPGPGPGGVAGPGSGYTEAEYLACARRAREQALMEGDDPLDSPVTQECANPASDPRPWAKRTGQSAELDTYCSQRDDEDHEVDLEEMLAGGGDPEDCDRPAGAANLAGTCGDQIFSEGSRGTIGVAFGAVIGIDTCDPSICDPSTVLR